jgi:hypothetical protein
MVVVLCDYALSGETPALLSRLLQLLQVIMQGRSARTSVYRLADNRLDLVRRQSRLVYSRSFLNETALV